MTVKESRAAAGLSQKDMADLLSIPKRTIENWEQGVNEPPEYLVKLITYYLQKEGYIK